MRIQNALQEQYDVIIDRKNNDGGEKSYTNYLYREGLNKILKKCGEECFETVIAAKNGVAQETIGELCDVFYHSTVLLGQENVSFDDVMRSLNVRCQTEGQPIDSLFSVIAERKQETKKTSYTAYLFHEGLDKILKKVGEACTLLLVAAKAENRPRISEEMANLIYHLMVMMVCEKISPDALGEALDQRNGKTGNLKQFHQTDPNT